MIKHGEVHTWIFDLDNRDQTNRNWEKILSAEETNRSKRYLTEKDRQRFTARRGLLRQLLSRYTNIQAAEIVYATNPYGKLSLPANPVKFNLSICQGRVIYAFALEMEVGVDLEQVRKLDEHEHMVGHWFSPDEQASLDCLAPELQVEAFYHVWTQKEAFIKAHGKGLSLPLKDFSVSVDPNLPGGLLSIRGGAGDVSKWKIYTHTPTAGWRAAVCARAEAEVEVHWNMNELAGSVV
jgi:4'-phosphopantetheinyl transferase